MTKQPLKDILEVTRGVWDQAGVRNSVRLNFSKVLKCRTAVLGSEIYASATERKVVPHTCKSRSCPSCGHRATLLWQREQWAALPEMPYAGVVLTMPDVLWGIFRENRDLLNDLPALGAAVIQQVAEEQFRAKIMVMVVRHTFGRHLNFNPHLHTMTSTVGLSLDCPKLVSGIRFKRETLMVRWRYAVITYLRAALKGGWLISNSSPAEVSAVLAAQCGRWWNVKVQRAGSKEHFLRYAARYVRRPPIAQYRIVESPDDGVRFRTVDHRLKKEVITDYNRDDFVRTLADHVPDHYSHAIRRFGLLAPRTIRRTSATFFALLGQRQRPRPRPLSWAYSIKKRFGVNPLQDSKGETMRWIARRTPTSATSGT